jgi:hypothetical protein
MQEHKNVENYPLQSFFRTSNLGLNKKTILFWLGIQIDSNSINKFDKLGSPESVEKNKNQSQISLFSVSF